MRRIAVAALLVACASGKPAPKPPAAPTGVSATAGDGQVTVLWNAVDAALGYRVYSGEGALTTHADVGAVTSWTVVGLTNGHTYSFAVSALGAGGEGALSAAVTATPKANPPLSVTSVTPADGATAVPRNAAVVFTFNKAVQAPTAGCSGTAQLSDDSFATCAAGTFASSEADATWTFTPVAPLHGGAKYVARVTAAQKDANGVALAAQFQSLGFTTAAALTVSVSPSGTVGVRPDIVLTFNRAVDPSTVTSIESGSTCGGTVQLSAAGACAAMTHAWSGNTATFALAADLTPSTAYAISVGTGVTDSDGVPLDAAAAGGFTTTAAVTKGAVDFQHVSFSWTGSNGAHAYVRPAGASWPLTPSFTLSGSAGTLTLTPGKTWDVRIAPLDGAAHETSPSDFLAIATDFAGTASEWLAGQLATGAASPGGHFRFTASDTELFAAYSSSDDSTTLQAANGDALWVAIDTDPAADTTGEWQTVTGGSGTIVWPFKADYVIELKNGATNLRTVGAAPQWAPLATPSTISGSIAEIRFARSVFGNPAIYRVAFAALATNTGYTFDSAPAVALHVPTFAQQATTTDSLTPAADPATAVSGGTVAGGPLAHLKITGASSAVALKGSLAPLSYASPLPLGAAGEGYVNLGGQTGELFFKFTDTGTDEFAPGKDRVWTLSGSAEAVPALTWNVSYSATHSCTLTFVVTDATNAPTEVRGNDSALGNWGAAAGAALSGTNPYTAGSVSFSSHDFVATPLQFKAWYGSSSTYEGPPGSSNDIMDDDVINSRTLIWNACASATCATF